jgi:transcription initiation factor TFIIIB Brf1 subunit/transcription initiation factor TFIIB
MVTATEVDGEYTCVKCGRVFGSVEVAGIEEIRSHYISHIEYGAKQIGKHASKLVTCLNLPDFALETIMRVADELTEAKVKQKQALLFSILYACREHNIPRSLGNILDAMRQVYGTEIAKSSASLLKLLNKTAKKAYELGYRIRSPDKHYYLKAYLAKIQNVVINETSNEYYEYLRSRAFKTIERLDTEDASYAAKNAIVSNTCRTLQWKLHKVLGGDLNV